jgi:hypothetical protein
MLKKDIPLDQAVGLVRACQKLNCDTADQLFSVVERRCREANMPLKVTPAMQDAAWRVLTRVSATTSGSVTQDQSAASKSARPSRRRYAPTRCRAVATG